MNLWLLLVTMMMMMMMLLLLAGGGAADNAYRLEGGNVSRLILVFDHRSFAPIPPPHVCFGMGEEEGTWVHKEEKPESGSHKSKQ